MLHIQPDGAWKVLKEKLEKLPKTIGNIILLKTWPSNCCQSCTEQSIKYWVKTEYFVCVSVCLFLLHLQDFQANFSPFVIMEYCMQDFEVKNILIHFVTQQNV